MSTSDSFLSWVRSGIATAIPDSGSGNTPRRTTLNIGVRVNAQYIRDVPMQLHGPGDVIGIDPRAIVRTTPLPGSTDFEPNYFPAIEFAEPSFPWLFTPTGTADQRLTPWICLAVVRKQDDVIFEDADPKQPLPVLVFKGAARPLDELPPLEEAWAWAHTQVTWERGAATGADVDRLAAILRDTPGLARSRLVCPRRLEPGAQYYACVLPVFDAGVKAGLGASTAADEGPGVPQLAWRSGVSPGLPFRLPVYHRWEFTAGAAGDFESLVRRIVKRTKLPGVGQRPMDVSHVGPRALDMPGTVLGLEGALRPAGMTPVAWDPVMRSRFEAALTPLLNAGADVSPAAAGDPIVGAPLYGHAQAGQHTVPAAGHPLAWMRTLNLDPRTRSAAAFGTAVVQKDQEALMASAWAQLAEIRRLNVALRQAQLAREIAAVTHRERLSALSAAATLAVARPALTRVGTSDPSLAGINTLMTAVSAGVQAASVPTFQSWVSKSAIGAGALSAEFQAVSRPGGPVARRLFAQVEPVRAEVVKRLNDRRIAAAPPRGLPDKAVTIDEVTNRLVKDAGPRYENVRLGSAVPEQFFPGMEGWVDGWQYHNSPLPRGPIELVPATAKMIRDDRDSYEPRPPRLPPRGTDPRRRLNAAFREAALKHQRYLLNGRTLVEPPPPPPSRDLDALKKQLLIALEPEQTFARRVRGRVTDAPPALWRRPDALDAVIASPSYPQAMSEPLRQLSPELILPGAEHVPPDTMAVLEPNHRFIEAYLVGLNHEMTRELIWRGYSGDVTGTSFRHFWQTTGAPINPDPGCPNGEDVRPIGEWRGKPLGTNACGASARSPLILLLRTDLLRRYPTASIYAIKAVNTGSGRAPGTMQVQPIFRGAIDPDITFLGFNITEAQAKGTGTGDDQGYYLVVQQHPTAPLFGLAAEKTPGIPARWRSLSWDDLPPTAANTRPTHVRVSAAVPTPTSPESLVWGGNAANMAGITQRTPARIARHFSLILAASPAPRR